jgi:hypothetical protein
VRATDLLSTAQAAKELGGLSRRRVIALITSGKLKATRVQVGMSGDRIVYLIKRKDLEPVRNRPKPGGQFKPGAPYHRWRERYPKKETATSE